MPANLRYISAVRINAIMQALVDVRTLPGDLTFLRRTAVVPASDGEIMASYTGRVQIADLIADDQRAVVYQPGKWTFETHTVPNLKHGIMLTQEHLNQLFALAAGVPIPGDNLFGDFENRTIDDLLLGVRQRMNALIAAMWIDGFSYDRLGIKMTNVTWGMLSDLKVTPAITWDTAATAKPISDIQSLRLLARVRYGQTYNRITMSTTAFQHMIATTEFRDRVKLVLNPAMAVTALPFEDLDTMRNLAGSLLGMTVELEDNRYWSQDAAGALTSAPYLPITKVVLSNSGDDNTPAAMDFANGVTTESLVSALAPTNMVGQFPGPTRGPIAYATAEPTLNPPNITYWGVGRGFSRKHRKQATAVLTVGTFSDNIPVTEPA